MGFHEKYTTAKKVSDEADFLKSLDAGQLLDYCKVTKLEKEKVVLSNDFFALNESIELLINTMRNK